VYVPYRLERRSLSTVWVVFTYFSLAFVCWHKRHRKARERSEPLAQFGPKGAVGRGDTERAIASEPLAQFGPVGAASSEGVSPPKPTTGSPSRDHISSLSAFPTLSQAKPEDRHLQGVHPEGAKSSARHPVLADTDDESSDGETVNL
jgi:hypothetical protein